MLQTSGRWRSSKARHCHGCGCCNCCNGHPAGKKTPVGPGRSHGEMAGFSNWSTGACSQVLYPQRSPLTGLFLFIWVARSATPISKKLQPCSEHWPFMDVGKKCPLFPPATEDSGPAPCSDRRTPGHDCPSATEYPLQALRWQPSPDQWVGSTKIQYPAPPKKNCWAPSVVIWFEHLLQCTAVFPNFPESCWWPATWLFRASCILFSGVPVWTFSEEMAERHPISTDTDMFLGISKRIDN